MPAHQLPMLCEFAVRVLPVLDNVQVWLVMWRGKADEGFVEDFGFNFYWGPPSDILMKWFCTQQPETYSKICQIKSFPFSKPYDGFPMLLRVKTMVLSMACKTPCGLVSCYISEFITLQYRVSVLLSVPERQASLWFWGTASRQAFQ